MKPDRFTGLDRAAGQFIPGFFNLEKAASFQQFGLRAAA
jgi:hypothetical protein